MIQSIIKLIRVKHWAKNLFILIPIFFSGKIMDGTALLQVISTFFAFSFVASSIYIINDFIDMESDKLHPQKKNRPLARGTIGKRVAIVLCLVFMLTGLVIGFVSETGIFYYLLTYFIINIIYTFKLKHVAIIDINIIAIGFILRVLIGGEAACVTVSKWLILLTFLLALVLALGKRRGELIGINDGLGKKTRSSLDGYSIPFIDASIYIICAVAVVAYIMYCFSEEIQLSLGTEKIYFSVVIVMAAILRYLQQTIVFNQTESPTRVLYKDRFIQTALMIWILFFWWLLYMG